MWETWLLESNVRQALEHAHTAGIMPTTKQQIEFEARHTALAADPTSRVLSVAGNTAEVSIKGVITNTPNFMAMLFGGGNVTYPEIISALAEADSDSSIKKAVLKIDSPGGTIDGLFDAIAAIQSFSKPLKAVISNTGASAAFALASQADEIIATNVAAKIGSIGIVASFCVDQNDVTITSTNAPKKAPDVTTEKGIAIVREELDPLHQIFVESIAVGRGTTVERINAEFGQGATLLAGEALKRGMIDGIATTSLSLVKSTDSTTTAIKGGDNSEKGPMDLTTLKTSHPEVYAAAVLEGATKERDRVAAHLIWGEASGDMKTAVAAVKDGTEMTAAITATYSAAAVNRQNVSDRQNDDDNSNAGDNAVASGNNVDSSQDVASLVEAQLGITEEA